MDQRDTHREVVVVNGQDRTIVQQCRAKMATLADSRIVYVEILPFVEDIFPVEVPGLTVVPADDGLAAAAVAEQHSLFDIRSNGHRQQQVVVGHSQQMSVHPAGLVEEVDRRPGFPVVLGNRDPRSFELVIVRSVDAAGRNSGAQRGNQPTVLGAHKRTFADAAGPGLSFVAVLPVPILRIDFVRPGAPAIVGPAEETVFGFADVIVLSRAAKVVADFRNMDRTVFVTLD